MAGKKKGSKTNGSGDAPPARTATSVSMEDGSEGIELQERRGPSSSSSGAGNGRRGFRFSAEIDEPLLRELTLRDDEGAVIHDDISDLEDSDGGGADSETEVKRDPEDGPYSRPRRDSITPPATVVGRTGPRFRNLKNFHETGGFNNFKGMNVFITALFIIGETAGGGLVALPTVMANCGLRLGTLVIVLGAFICGYAGVQLSECWSIMMLRYPKYRHHTHKPYPAIARRACGRKAGISVAGILNLTQFGTAVVFLLLGSRNSSSNIKYATGWDLSFCWVIVIFACCLYPLLLLRSPKDFWIPIMMAMITTLTACVLIMIGAWIDYDVCFPHNEMPTFDKDRIFQSFGTVMFAYGGHGAFPTIQHDMKKPHLFEKSVTGAFTGIASLYLPVSLVGALVYGSSLRDVVIFSIQSPLLQQTVNLLITMHVFLALTIVFNPINQDAESFFDVPEKISWKRMLIRGGVLSIVVFIALTVPSFGPLLDLVGASTITQMAIVMPPYFCLVLHARLSKFGTKGTALEPLRWTDLYTHNHPRKFFLNVALILLGCIGGTYSSWMAIQSLANAQFQRPCYADYLFGPASTIDLNAHADDSGIPMTQKFFCCGPYNNISAQGPQYCLEPSSITGGGHG